MSIPTLPEKFLDLLEKPICGILATITPPDKPHITVVWRLYEPPYVLVSSLLDSQKYRNLQLNPQVSLMMLDPTSPYRYLTVRGVVTAFLPDPQGDMIDRISWFYENEPYYGGSEPAADKGKFPHVTYQITPSQFISH